SARSATSVAGVRTPTQISASGSWSRCTSVQTSGTSSAMGGAAYPAGARASSLAREAVLRCDLGREVCGGGASRRGEDPDERQLVVVARVLDDVYLAWPEPEGGPAGEALGRVTHVEPARAFDDPDDLVVQVVVPGRPARREVPDEERGARRARVRPEQDLERARA